MSWSLTTFRFSWVPSNLSGSAIFSAQDVDCGTAAGTAERARPFMITSVSASHCCSRPSPVMYSSHSNRGTSRSAQRQATSSLEGRPLKDHVERVDERSR